MTETVNKELHEEQPVEAMPASGCSCFLGLGSNLGDRLSYLREAVRKLDSHPEITVTRKSPVYETSAHTLDGSDGQPSYLNAVVEVITDLDPLALLDVCNSIERAAGRDRTGGKWAPRTLDIDLLVCGNLVSNTPELQLPHPRIGDRLFVLRPLADLAPSLYVPLPFDATVSDLLAACRDNGTIREVPEQL